jgi:hypothetical protein
MTRGEFIHQAILIYMGQKFDAYTSVVKAQMAACDVERAGVCVDEPAKLSAGEKWLEEMKD